MFSALARIGVTFAPVGDDLEAVCFVAGTRILTATGQRPVETLQPGDSVVTQAGDERIARLVKWVGRRRVDVASHQWPHTVAPIRIHQGAIDDNTPHRDLYVAPDHAVFVDGLLIAARLLTNGVSIVQDLQATAIDYVLVELDQHSILLAEGLPAESHFDAGDRELPARVVRLASDNAEVKLVRQRLADRGARRRCLSPAVATTDDPGLAIRFKGKVFPRCIPRMACSSSPCRAARPT